VQNFVSAAVGMAVAAALVRGFARASTYRIGNFWVDLTRGVTRVLLQGRVLGFLGEPAVNVTRLNLGVADARGGGGAG
jgi:potassium-transporting ATPase potassium-binding subunit